MHTPCPDDLSLTSKRHSHKDFKANKTFIVQFFSIFFFFFTKTCIHTQGMAGLGEDTHTHSYTHARTHTHKHFLGPRPDLKSLEDFWGGLPSPMSVYSPTLSPLSQASPMWGSSHSRGGGTPETEGRLILGAVTRHPWACVVLLRGDEGLAPLGQEAQDSAPVCCTKALRWST